MISSGGSKQAYYFLLGVVFLALAKAKHWLRGYVTPKPFSFEDIDRCIDHDVRIARHWLSEGIDIVGRDILEIGPGSDLGTGFYLLSQGANSYCAVDKNDLAGSVPNEFYRRLEERYNVPSFEPALRTGKIRYLVDPEFDLLSMLEADSCDLILSCAAFEHLEDVESTVTQLTALVRPGGKLCAVVDLQTHSRWIRERDPNNIYRYPEWLYRLFFFPGQPNRLRPTEYKHIFELNGWEISSMTCGSMFESAGRAVHKDFQNDPHLDWLTFTLLGTKKSQDAVE